MVAISEDRGLEEFTELALATVSFILEEPLSPLKH